MATATKLTYKAVDVQRVDGYKSFLGKVTVEAKLGKTVLSNLVISISRGKNKLYANAPGSKMVNTSMGWKMYHDATGPLVEESVKVAQVAWKEATKA